MWKVAEVIGSDWRWVSLQLGKKLGQNPRMALPAGTTTGHHGSPWRPRFFRQQLRIGVYEIHRRREVGPLGAGMGKEF